MYVWKHKRRICNLILGLKGLNNAVLNVTVFTPRVNQTWSLACNTPPGWFYFKRLIFFFFFKPRCHRPFSADIQIKFLSVRISDRWRIFFNNSQFNFIGRNITCMSVLKGRRERFGRHVLKKNELLSPLFCSPLSKRILLARMFLSVK